MPWLECWRVVFRLLTLAYQSRIISGVILSIGVVPSVPNSGTGNGAICLSSRNWYEPFVRAAMGFPVRDTRVAMTFVAYGTSSGAVWESAGCGGGVGSGAAKRVAGGVHMFRSMSSSSSASQPWPRSLVVKVFGALCVARSGPTYLACQRLDGSRRRDPNPRRPPFAWGDMQLLPWNGLGTELSGSRRLRMDAENCA
jgi:hypothetical protein